MGTVESVHLTHGILEDGLGFYKRLADRADRRRGRAVPWRAPKRWQRRAALHGGGGPPVLPGGVPGVPRDAPRASHLWPRLRTACVHHVWRLTLHTSCNSLQSCVPMKLTYVGVAHSCLHCAMQADITKVRLGYAKGCTPSCGPDRVLVCAAGQAWHWAARSWSRAALAASP